MANKQSLNIKKTKQTFFFKNSVKTIYRLKLQNERPYKIKDHSLPTKSCH